MPLKNTTSAEGKSVAVNLVFRTRPAPFPVVALAIARVATPPFPVEMAKSSPLFFIESGCTTGELLLRRTISTHSPVSGKIGADGW